MPPLDMTVVLLAVGGCVNALVNLTKKGGWASTPARTVALALLSGEALVALYAFQPFYFSLVAGGILVAAGAAGLAAIGKDATPPPTV